MGLGIMLIITGVLVVIGGGIFIAAAGEDGNTARAVGEGGALIAVGAIIMALGGIKIRKSPRRRLRHMPTCAKCSADVAKVYDCDHTDFEDYCVECYTELHYYLTEQ